MVDRLNEETKQKTNQDRLEEVNRSLSSAYLKKLKFWLKAKIVQTHPGAGEIGVFKFNGAPI